jgi:hypothetical protein
MYPLSQKKDETGDAKGGDAKGSLADIDVICGGFP